MAVSERAKPATSTDVARLAGVSRATVSRILNGDEAAFPEKTRDRVREAARQLRYRPSPAGRSLVSGRSDTIVVLLPNSTFGSNLQDAVDEVVNKTRPFNGNVVVRFAGPSAAATTNALESLRPLAVVNFGVLTGDQIVELRGRGVIVVPNHSMPDRSRMDGGVADMQARLLAARGITDFWFAALSDTRLDPYGPGRFVALRAFCRRESLPEPQHLDVPLSLVEATEALRRLMVGRTNVGVVCYNDDVAIALLAAARDLGVSVPDELALVGVDHTPVGQLWKPRLTTIHVDFRGLVAEIAEAMQEQITGVPAAAETPVSQFFTVVRGDTA